MHRNRRTMWLARSALVLGLWGGVTAAEAVGLGKLTVLSALDEPLRAEIELTAASAAELKKLNAALAPRTEFESAGIDRPAHLFDIKYTVTARSDGRPVLRLSTDQPVREPFLHFLLQLDWSGGRLIREYTALLDPPHILAARAGHIEAPRAEANPPAQAIADDNASAPAATPAPVALAAEAPTVVAQRPAPAAAAVDEELYGPSLDSAVAADNPAAPKSELVSPAADAAVMAAPNGAPSAVQAVPSVTTYGPVKRGETLGTIVRGLPRDANISAEQTMLALLKHNKSAFVANNINGLRAGKVLKIPTATEMGAIAAPQAARDFRAQYNSWQEYKLKLANTAQVLKQPSDGASAKGEIAAKPATVGDAAPAKGANTELLKIVRAGSDASGKGSEGGRAERQALSDKVATLEEVVSSKELENKELRERVTQLEAQIKNAKRLIELENKDLAKAQNQAAKPAPAPVTAPTQKPSTGAAAKAQTETPAPNNAAATPKAAEPKASAPNVTPKPAPKPAPALVEEEPSLWASLSNNALLLPVGGALLAVLFGGLLIHYRRRRQALAEFGESILSGGLNLNSEGTPANAADANGGEVSFLSDFSQGGMGNIHTDEVDPIAEAEVYLAYGRDEQAEEILKEAVVKDPARHELRLKLLEIYHQRNDVGAFETVAEELYAALEGKGGKVWEAVEEMGYKMNPDNPMFRAGAKRVGATAGAAAAMAATLPAATANDADLMAFDLPQGGGDTGTIDFAPRSSAPATPADGASDFSFDLDFSTADTGAGAQDGSPAGIDFGTEVANDALSTGNAAASNSGTDASAGSADAGIDFDFSSFALEDTTAAPNADTADSASNLDFGTDSIDMPPVDNDNAGGEFAFEASALDDGTDAGDASESLGGDGEGAQIDETATKLDLAKAYIDMGDADGARSILDEVLAEGNDIQRRQAAALAAQIAA